MKSLISLIALTLCTLGALDTIVNPNSTSIIFGAMFSIGAIISTILYFKA